MRLRIVSWNVNSVRLRLDHILRFVREQKPDVLCLQEIKCLPDQFPREALAAAGLPHQLVGGQKGWHGVAIASALPLEPTAPLDLCREGHARCASTRIAGVEVINLYVPAGGDVPDRGVNPKFDHKLDFYARLTAAMARRDPRDPLVLLGDLNIAPGEADVWNHRHMSKIVSHTPIEVEAMETARRSLGFVDLVRLTTPEPEKLFSWWSYRAADFRNSNRGLRLDHIWASPGLHAATARNAPPHTVILDHVREWERPSDHAPVVADLAV